MKHFLKRFAPGADRFEDVKTQPAQNGAPILNEALAYMECEVVSRMDCGDHWAVYSTVYAGRVSKPDALTAFTTAKLETITRAGLWITDEHRYTQIKSKFHICYICVSFSSS